MQGFQQKMDWISCKIQNSIDFERSRSHTAGHPAGTSAFARCIRKPRAGGSVSHMILCINCMQCSTSE